VRTEAACVVVVRGVEVAGGAFDVVVAGGVVVETVATDVVVVAEGLSRCPDVVPMTTTNARTPRTAMTTPTATETLAFFDTCGS